MIDQAAFQYAVIRIVPHEARGEFINAGVILFCPSHQFLQARISFDPDRLRSLAPNADAAQAEKHLTAIPIICAGGGGRRGARQTFSCRTLPLAHLAAQHAHSNVTRSRRSHGKSASHVGPSPPEPGLG